MKKVESAREGVVRKTNSTRQSRERAQLTFRLIQNFLWFWTCGKMETQTHKAHRPAQSGSKAEKKGKGKQKSGFNEKVLGVIRSLQFSY